MASSELVGEGGRTKYKAYAAWMASELSGVTGKEFQPEFVDKAAYYLKEAPTTTPKADKRFPHMNQVNACWTAINEYQACVEHRGKDECGQLGRTYASLCPQKWVSDWKAQTEAGVSMSVGKAFVE